NPEELCAAPGAGGQRDRLWARYVSAMQKRAYDPAGALPDAQPSPYGEEQVMRWLGWIALEMPRMNRTELWLHECTGPRLIRATVRVVVGIAVALAVALVGWLVAAGWVGWLVLELVYGPVVGVVLRPTPAFRRQFDDSRLLAGLAGGLAGGLTSGLAVQ